MVISIRDCITDCTATVHLVYTEKKKKAAVLFSFLMALLYSSPDNSSKQVIQVLRMLLGHKSILYGTRILCYCALL